MHWPLAAKILFVFKSAFFRNDGDAKPDLYFQVAPAALGPISSCRASETHWSLARGKYLQKKKNHISIFYLFIYAYIYIRIYIYIYIYKKIYTSAFHEPLAAKIIFVFKKCLFRNIEFIKKMFLWENVNLMR